MIKQKIVNVRRDLEELAAFKSLSFDQIAKDYRNHKIVERIIEVVINEAIDINQHLIVKGGYSELPFDFKESFLLLVKLGVYPKDFADEISRSVGLRNILVHQYRELDENFFYGAIKESVAQYARYCDFILEYLKKSKAIEDI